MLLLVFKIEARCILWKGSYKHLRYDQCCLKLLNGVYGFIGHEFLMIYIIILKERKQGPSHSVDFITLAKAYIYIYIHI